MTTITINQAVLEQVLELLDQAGGYGEGLSEIDAAYGVIHDVLYPPSNIEPVSNDDGQAQTVDAPEPLIHKHEWFRTGAMAYGVCRCIHCGAWNHEIESHKRQPLTDEEIDALELPESGTGTIRDLVRVVEKAHGIGGDK
jgi:hypothetical protein